MNLFVLRYMFCSTMLWKQRINWHDCRQKWLILRYCFHFGNKGPDNKSLLSRSLASLVMTISRETDLRSDTEYWLNFIYFDIWSCRFVNFEFTGWVKIQNLQYDNSVNTKFTICQLHSDTHEFYCMVSKKYIYFIISHNKCSFTKSHMQKV